VILGVNIGKSKSVDNTEAIADYAASFQTLFDFADYFTVNVSSPNTPGLRQLQDREPLAALLAHLQRLNGELAARRSTVRRPIVVKIAPDLSEEQLDEVAGIVADVRLDGVIATNTTVYREGLSTSSRRIERLGAGGISGAPLTIRSRRIVSFLRRKLGDQVTIIGSGGLMTGDDAWRMLAAGANLVQLYTGFVYGGPAIIRQFAQRILGQLDKFGIENVERLAASDVKQRVVDL
jgi:dihydroorotate dehydrogenase